MERQQTGAPFTASQPDECLTQGMQLDISQ